MATTGAHTPQFSQKQPGGAFAYADIRRHPAAVFFVDSGNTNATDGLGFGQNPDLPFATLDYAIGQCTDSGGDVIYLMPGHTEDIDGAAGVDLDVIGISVRGLGEGALQPKFTFSDAASDIDIDAASITVENVHFVAAAADIAALIDVNSTDFTLRNCRFSQSAAALNAKICVQDGGTTTSSRLTIENCEAVMYDAANTHFVNIAGNGDGIVIRNNILLGDWGSVAVGGAGTPTHITIADNYLYDASTTADGGVALNASATGIICNNLLGITLAGNATTGVKADGCALVENYVVDIGDRQGVLDPAAT